MYFIVTYNIIIYINIYIYILSCILDMYTTIFFFSILPRLRAVVVKFIRLKIYKKKQKKENRKK